MNLRKVLIKSFICCILLPYILLSGLLAGYYLEYKKGIHANQRYIEKLTSLVLENYHQNISNFKDSIVTSKEFADFMTTYSAFGNLTSNALYGRVIDSARYRRDIKNITIMSSEKVKIFEFENTVPVKSKTFMTVDYPIKLDDQSLNSPSSRLQGFLSIQIGTNVIEELLPKNAFISGISAGKPLIGYRMSDSWIYSYLPYMLSTLGFFIAALAFVGLWIANRSILMPIQKIVEGLKRKSELHPDTVFQATNEIFLLQEALDHYESYIEDTKLKLIKKEKEFALIKVAHQVAHDIRSPLEVLKCIKSDLILLPSESRRRIQMSINRIEEIAYNLLKTYKNESPNINSHETEEISSLVLSVVTEKRIEFRNKNNLSINASIEKTYGTFSGFDRTTLKNIISNLINNSVEALDENVGNIILEIIPGKDWHLVTVSDNGPGINLEIQDQIFKKGFTTKSAGNGIGLWNAKEELITCGGSFDFESNNNGTVFKITIPATKAPVTFIGSLNLYNYTKIIILDDDPSFHEVWLNKLKFCKAQVEHFYSVQEILSVYDKIELHNLLISDFELMDEVLDGIGVIKKLNCTKNSILVTARSEEKGIQDACRELSIRIVPKSMIEFLTTKVIRPNVVLIDDDKFIHLNWSMYFKTVDLSLICYFSVEDFLKDSSLYDFNVPIFVDSDLGSNIHGELESEKMHLRGFENIFLSTGFNKEEILKPIWIKDVFSKDPRAIYNSFMHLN